MFGIRKAIWRDLILMLVVVLGITGCVDNPDVSDISNDHDRGYNFPELLKGRCFRTTADSLLDGPQWLLGYSLTSPEETNLRSDAAQRSQRIVAAARPVYSQYFSVVLPAGTEFRVLRLLWDNGDTGGYYIVAVILNGQMEGLVVEALDFFVTRGSGGPGNSKDSSQFIIGPFVELCRHGENQTQPTRP